MIKRSSYIVLKISLGIDKAFVVYTCYKGFWHMIRIMWEEKKCKTKILKSQLIIQSMVCGLNGYG